MSMDDLVARLQKVIEVTPILPMTETRAQQLPGFYVAVTLDNARHAQEVCTASNFHVHRAESSPATGALRNDNAIPGARAGQRQRRAWTSRTQNSPLSRATTSVNCRTTNRPT